MAKALMPLADGAEEMEAVIVIDTLRRAKWEVTSASISGETIKASRGVRLIPDVKWESIDPDSFDIIILPGGAEGTKALCEHEGVLETVRNFANSQKLIAAICAAPLVLQTAGILENRDVTCHPSIVSQIKTGNARDDRVVIDGSIITSQGPGTAFDFALAIIEKVDGADTAKTVAEGMVI